MYKGCTRDTQGTNTLAIPEQHRSNTLSPGLPHARSSASVPSRQIGPTRPVQGRNPKTEGREKAEIRSPEFIAIAAEWQPIGFRPSFGFRVSAFGFQGCRTWSPFNQPDFRAALPLHLGLPLAPPKGVRYPYMRDFSEYYWWTRQPRCLRAGCHAVCQFPADDEIRVNSPSLR